MRLAVLVPLLATYALAACTRTPAILSHSLENRVHVVATAPATCPVCSLYALHRDSVVRILTPDGLGAGVIISADGDVLTSAHVVKGAQPLVMQTYDQVDHAAEVILIDEHIDLAVVRTIEVPVGWQPIELAGHEELAVGSSVYVIGHPIGLGWTVTQGIVSALRPAGEAGPTELIQTDANISPGNSGGPLLDERGRLVGIVRSKLVGAGIGNIAFAVPLPVAAAFLEKRSLRSEPLP